MIRVAIESTSGIIKDYVKEFNNLEDAINYCRSLKSRDSFDENPIIVTKPEDYYFTEKDKIPITKIDWELEIYDDYRE